MGRSAAGVRGMRLDNSKDRVVGMVCVDPEDEFISIFVISENGYGKRTKLDEYRITNRGGKGVKTMNISDKTGELVAIKLVTDEDDLIISNKSGITIRVRMAEFREMGRATQGVKVIRIDKGDAIADVAVIPAENEDSDEEE
jgi:DNA gyrase subunit A